MKYKIVACYDAQLKCFMPPQAVNDMLDEDIVESNRRAVLNGSIPANRAKNLIVFKIGVFNDLTGELQTFEPVELCKLFDFLPRKVDVVEEVKKDVQSSD